MFSSHLFPSVSIALSYLCFRLDWGTWGERLCPSLHGSAGQRCTTVLKWAPLGTKKHPECVLCFRGKAVSSFRRTVSMSVIAENLITQTQEKLFQVFPNSHLSFLCQEQSSSDLGKVVSFMAQAHHRPQEEHVRGRAQKKPGRGFLEALPPLVGSLLDGISRAGATTAMQPASLGPPLEPARQLLNCGLFFTLWIVNSF